jgi:hypothetical protein
MAVPGRRDDLVGDDLVDDDGIGEEYMAPSDDEEAQLPDELFRLADAAQSGNVAALRAALGTEA